MFNLSSRALFQSILKKFSDELGAEEDKLLQKQLDKRMEECGGDLKTYMERYNRHTLRISLVDEQVGEELWGDKSITFFNEDNAISHMGFLSDLLDLLTAFCKDDLASK